ncbi:MAG: sodium:solute symporter family protein [Verrucomicrobiales bacterium]
MSAELFLSCFFIYIAGMIGFGCWVSRRKQSGDDFLLGGRTVPLFLTLGTTVATMVGTGSSMGAVGKAYQSGWMGALYGIGGAIGILTTAWLFAPMRQHRFMTMAEEISSYVGANRGVANLVGVFTYLSSVGWLGAHILGGAKYLEFVTGLSPIWAKLWIAGGFGIYAVIGGYRAVIWTDTLQAIVLFGGFLLTATFAFQAAGAWSGLAEINAAIVAGGGRAELLPSLSLIVVIAVGVLGTPSFRQRIYSGNSVADVRKAFVGSGILYLGFAILPAIIGIAAYGANPALSNRDLAFPWMATEMLPAALGMLILLAGLSATMSSASSDAISGVTTVIRDLYLSVFGRMPRPDRVVRYSRLALGTTTGLALAMAMVSDNIIGYISDIIALFITGLCVSGILGRLWPPYNAPGAVASLVAASATAIYFKSQPGLCELWGNPVIPSLVISALAGIAVSLATPHDPCSHSEALARLQRERDQMED